MNDQRAFCSREDVNSTSCPWRPVPLTNEPYRFAYMTLATASKADQVNAFDRSSRDSKRPAHFLFTEQKEASSVLLGLCAKLRGTFSQDDSVVSGLLPLNLRKFKLS
jgi:hypothetical protein